MHVGSRSAVGFTSAADLEHCGADRAADRAFDKGQALIVDKHRAREQANARARIQSMFDRERSLRLRKARIGWLFQRNKVAARLVGAEPIPSLALGHVVLG